MAAVVVVSHAWIDDQVGGAYRVASEFAEHLAASGCRVCYVCGTSKWVFDNPTLVRGVELWRYQYPRHSSPHPLNLIGHLRGAYRVTRSIAKSMTIMGLNGHSPLQFLGASLAIGRAQIKQVYSVHSPFDDELFENWTGSTIGIRRRISLGIARAIERENCRRATQVHTLSEYTLNLLRQKFPRIMQAKGLICPGWVDTGRFVPAVSRKSARAQLDPVWRVDCPLFFTLRRLEPRMGLDRLLDAVHRLKTGRPDRPFRLIIGGAGSLRTELREHVIRLGLENCVFLIGRVDDDVLPGCFAASDCFVLPTVALECFGLIVLESYACATPVIATPVGAIPELIQEEQRSWLTAGTGSADIADRMQEFLDGRLTCDANRLRQVAERFRIDQSATRLSESCLDGIAGGM